MRYLLRAYRRGELVDQASIHASSVANAASDALSFIEERRQVEPEGAWATDCLVQLADPDGRIVASLGSR